MHKIKITYAADYDFQKYHVSFFCELVIKYQYIAKFTELKDAYKFARMKSLETGIPLDVEELSETAKKIIKKLDV